MIAKMLENFGEQVEHALNLGGNIKFNNFDKVIVCGMGGSGISGYILKDILDVPVVVNQGVNIPKWVDKNTLAFVMSHSGNTKETLEMYRQVIKKTDKMVAVTTGGILAKKVKNAIIIPSGGLPKNNFHYLFFPMLNVMKNSGVLKFNVRDILNAIKLVDKNGAKDLASKLKGKTPLVYTRDDYFGTALRWKQNFNETSKQLAIASSYPEFFHNEIEGDFSKFGVVMIEDSKDERIEYFKTIVKCNVVKLQGNGKVARSVYGIHTGDYTAFNLALMNNIDPDSEFRIDGLKEKFP